MYVVDGTTITLTRGDTFEATIELLDAAGEKYVPDPADVIRFKCKKGWSDDFVTLIETVIPNDSLELYLAPEDTQGLAFGDYVYDIQITTASGMVDTFLNGTLTLTGESDTHG